MPAIDRPDNNRTTISCGVLGASASEICAYLRARSPDVDFFSCHAYSDLGSLLTDHTPEALLAYKVGAGFPRDLILHDPHLRWLHVGGAGVDHLTPWNGSRLTITNSRGVHDRAIAEYVMATILAHHHNLPAYQHNQAQRLWRKRQSRVVRAQGILIIGLGSIGVEVAKLATAVGMTVYGVNSDGRPSPHAKAVTTIEHVDRLLPLADNVVITLPLTARTEGIIRAPVLDTLKPQAVVVNVSRGGVVEEDYMLRLAQGARSPAFYVDVFGTEPLPEESAIWSNATITVTPHVAGDFAGWEFAIADLFAENVALFQQGKPLRNVVPSEREY